MKWLQAGILALLSPVLLGILLLFTAMVVLCFPSFACARLRAVRYVAVAGLCYYAIFITLVSMYLEWVWWEILLAGGAASFLGWLLPDPISFLFRPERRRAVIRAVEHFERLKSEYVNYTHVRILGKENGLHFVELEFGTDSRPPRRRWVSVSADGVVEAADFEFVEKRFGVQVLC